MTDDITWTLVGDEPVHGKDKFASLLAEMKNNKATKLKISSLITHGKEAAVEGEMTMQDGAVFGFADFYEFTSAGSSKVKSIRSYVVRI